MKARTLGIAACLGLAACSQQIAPQPQEAPPHKATAQASSVENAANILKVVATETCNKTGQQHEMLSQRIGVIDSTEPGATEYRVIWQYKCVD